MVLSNTYKKHVITPSRHSKLIYIAAIASVLALLISINHVLNSGIKAADAESIQKNHESVSAAFSESKVEQALNTADIVTDGLFADTYEYESDAESAFTSCLKSALLAYSMGEDLARQYESSCNSDATTAEYNSELGYALGVESPRSEELSRKSLARYAACYEPIYRTDDINIYIVIDRVCDALEDGKLSF